ncbi:MAG: queuosine precursor transporter [Francisellaceae bacterium]|jgi:queuosine precursor transporter|nr:queuosine precursor transporter [Francisellaceae bacterium]MBT6539301.1 queuosine precursor transporter [Francisellaceae bacterium]
MSNTNIIENNITNNLLNLPKSFKYFFFLNLVMAVALSASVITARKIVSIGPISFPCCNIIFSLLTFPITDVISEIWGKNYASKSVLFAFCAQALFVFFIQVSIFLPYNDSWPDQSMYVEILGTGPRILLASLVAFLTAQMWDVYIYAKLKKSTKGKYLWLRNNVSTISSQMINSFLLISIAYYGTHSIIELFLGSILIKVTIAILDTPLVYLAVSYITKNIDTKTLAYTEYE